MPTIKFTDRGIRALRPPADGRVEYWDIDLPGLGLRVSAQGRKTWVLMFRTHGGRQRRMTLGRYGPGLGLADARKIAGKHLREVAQGGDPAGDKKALRQAETFGELADLYIEKHAKPNKRSWETDDRIIRRDLKPAFGHRKAGEIRRADIISLLDDVKVRGGVMANRTFGVLRGVFRVGVEREILASNPCIGIPRPAKERARDRVLSDDEIVSVWGALDAEPADNAAFYRLLLLTAQRSGEVSRMRWADLDFSGGWWLLPAEFTKANRAHRVPLSLAAVTILEGLPRKGDWVFPGKVRKDGTPNNQWRTFSRMRNRSGIDFHGHDLRRTAASHMTGLGISRLVVSKILNHADRETTAIYDRHRYEPEMRAALVAWAARIEEIVSGKTAADNVVRLTPAS